MKKSDSSFNSVGDSFVQSVIVHSPRFRNAVTHEAPDGEVFSIPSKTVPDMSMKLYEMIERHQRGGSVKTYVGANVPTDSMVPIDLEMMDKVERKRLSGQVADFIATTRGKMMTAKQAEKQRQFDALVDERAKAFLRAQMLNAGSNGLDEQAEGSGAVTR